ncbi:cobalamin-dependent protein [Halobacillus sp. Cin3]|uniref:cobalamin B12-binding domain-containing protein n=1 Tax=Halobacillus sp. Cin3 TaxID=2928441 RepID=UPI00248D74FC|nr:cobalamin-dependent protein [Halobacillus sp. Cin3]
MDLHHEQLAQVFLSGDEEKALNYTYRLLENHPRAYVFENLITPAMYHVGKLWENNEISVADEHLATAICDFVLSKIESDHEVPKRRQQQNYKVLLFGVEEEQHYIGLKMVADTFKEHGWRVRYLGPDLPMEHSMLQIRKFQPDVIGISAALSYRIPAIKKSIEAFTQLEWKPTIMIGGRLAYKFDLSEFESDQVMVIKNIGHLTHWFKEGREESINETS